MASSANTDLLLVQSDYRWIPEDFWDLEVKAEKIPGPIGYFGQLSQTKPLYRGNKARQWLECNWVLQSKELSKLHWLTLQYQDDLFKRGLCLFELGPLDIHRDSATLLNDALVLILTAFLLKLKIDRLYLVTDLKDVLPGYQFQPLVWHSPVRVEAQLAFPDIDPIQHRPVIALTGAEWWQYPPAIAAHEKLAYLSKRVVNQEKQERQQKRPKKGSRGRSFLGLF